MSEAIRAATLAVVRGRHTRWLSSARSLLAVLVGDAVAAATPSVTSSPAPTRSAPARCASCARSRHRPRPGQRGQAGRWPLTWPSRCRCWSRRLASSAALRRPPRNAAQDRAALSRWLAALGQVVSDYAQLSAAAQARRCAGGGGAEAALRASPVATLAASYGLALVRHSGRHDRVDAGGVSPAKHALSVCPRCPMSSRSARRPQRSG